MIKKKGFLTITYSQKEKFIEQKKVMIDIPHFHKVEIDFSKIKYVVPFENYTLLYYDNRTSFKVQNIMSSNYHVNGDFNLESVDEVLGIQRSKAKCPAM